MSVINLEKFKCRCGCKKYSKPGRAFLPGHDLRAAMRCIVENYGSIEDFILEHQEN